MPWTKKDATRFTHLAVTPKLKELWTKVANGGLERGLSDSSAIREANAVVKRAAKKRG